MSQETIKKLGNELIRLCDGIECHGLVDYQYGVWEDQIESSKENLQIRLSLFYCADNPVLVLEECLDLFEDEADDSGRSR
jgi:hypothetical protein